MSGCRHIFLKAKGCLLFAIIGLFLLAIVGCQKKRTPEVLLIPSGYVGWMEIIYDRKDAAPLPTKDGKRVIKFDSTGRIATSSKLEEGWALDKFYYYTDSSTQELSSTGWGGGGVIWSEYTGSNGATFTSVFFVGTEKQFKEIGLKIRGEVGDIFIIRSGEYHKVK